MYFRRCVPTFRRNLPPQYSSSNPKAGVQFHTSRTIFLLSVLKAVILAFAARKPQISFKENCTALVVKSPFHCLDLGWVQSQRWKLKPAIKLYTTTVLSDRRDITDRKATLSGCPWVSKVCAVAVCSSTSQWHSFYRNMGQNRSKNRCDLSAAWFIRHFIIL